ncbi:DNA-binding response regulator [Paraflavitalea soli]|uniref:DNA-binding response regulator n=1 Tax=Paraflavitalea soli TaxID=2315862 RepID=A0A3B7MQH9_9BACT|nr:LytTR family DNA-binding domain-containing protein [Paraflavitalea soli]AXY75603.1 DNA-binding response regulator [Paraflavitalea soli]
MNKISCIIIDDEARNIAVLKKLIGEYCPLLIVEGEATNGASALKMIQQLQPPLVFLDVELYKTNAFEVLNQLPEIDFEIIFVTAFEKYAHKAFRVNAVDYLLKPIDIDDLQAAVKKAIERIQGKQGSGNANIIITPHLNHAVFSKIALPTQQGLSLYNVDDIVTCTAKGRYTYIDFIKDKSITVTGTLKDIEGKLPPAIFFRIHNSHLINLNYVKKYYKGKGGYVEMINGQSLEVSFRKRDEFLDRIRPQS